MPNVKYGTQEDKEQSHGIKQMTETDGCFL